MSSPTYPISQEVSPGQPTSYQQYNRLRADALRFGAVAADAVNLGVFLGRYMRGIRLSYLPDNRLRINFDPFNPPVLMINGYMCLAGGNVDLPAGSFNGGAADWYIFAVRSPGTTTFTLSVNTNPIEAPDQRMIGSVHWSGSDLDLYTLRTFCDEAPGNHEAVVCLQAYVNYSAQSSYSATNVCHQKLDWGKLAAGARAAYLSANLFTTSGIGYARLFDTTNANTVVEISTSATAPTTMVKSGDILSALPDGEVETRFEYRTTGTRVDCYWAAVIIEY